MRTHLLPNKYFRKGAELAVCTQAHLDRTMQRLSAGPWQPLGFKTTAQIFGRTVTMTCSSDATLISEQTVSASRVQSGRAESS
jgi:hypothetical protein